MSVLILLAVVLAVVAALVPLARWQLRREIRRYEARQRLVAHLDALRREIDKFTLLIGTALLPATTSAAQAMSRMATAFADLGRAGNPEGNSE